jgi:hypothetical protein
MLNFVLVISKTAVFKAITTYLRKRGTREEFLVGSVDESLRVYGCVCVCESQWQEQEPKWVYIGLYVYVCVCSAWVSNLRRHWALPVEENVLPQKWTVVPGRHCQEATRDMWLKNVEPVRLRSGGWVISQIVPTSDAFLLRNFRVATGPIFRLRRRQGFLLDFPRTAFCSRLVWDMSWVSRFSCIFMCRTYFRSCAGAKILCCSKNRVSSPVT